MKIELPNGVKVLKNVETDMLAVCWQFHLNKLEDTRDKIIKLGEYCCFEKISSERSREGELKHAQWLIDTGVYDYYNDPENGTPFEDLSEEGKAKVGDDWNSHTKKWSKWTPEKIIARDGWYEDEVYWFSITKDADYTYQLILKDGDWIAYCPGLKNTYNVFLNCGKECRLPNFSDWKEIKEIA